jgi:hypothetical protein
VSVSLGRKPKESLSLGVKLIAVLSPGRNLQERLGLGKNPQERLGLGKNPQERLGLGAKAVRVRKNLSSKAGGNRAAINNEIKVKCVPGNSGYGRKACKDHSKSGG